MNKVKWVTANLEDDILGFLSGKLTDGKDYKVIDVHQVTDVTNHQGDIDGTFLEDKVVVEDDLGNVNVFHHTWFDKPSTYVKKEVKCCDESFDDLVYSKVDKEGYGYYFIRLDTLSTEQKRHFTQYCSKVCTNFLHPTQDILMTSWDDRETKWQTYCSDLAAMSDTTWDEIGFNDIFKHRDEV